MAILNQLRTTVSSYGIQEQKCVYPSSSSDAISSKNARERVLRLFFLSSSISSLKWLFSFFSCHIKMYLNFRKQQQLLCCFSNIKLDFFSSLLKKQVSKKENYHMSDSFQASRLLLSFWQTTPLFSYSIRVFGFVVEQKAIDLFLATTNRQRVKANNSCRTQPPMIHHFLNCHPQVSSPMGADPKVSEKRNFVTFNFHRE